MFHLDSCEVRKYLEEAGNSVSISLESAEFRHVADLSHHPELPDLFSELV